MKDYKKLFTMLLDVIPSSVVLLSRDLRIISVNQNFLLKNKLNISGTVGYQLTEVFPEIILKEINIVDQIRQVFKTNLPTTGQRMSYRAPGVPLTNYYYRIIPYSHEGIVEGVIFLMDDITEKIRLSDEVDRVESCLISVVECASDMVLSLDIDGRILTWNPSAERISGYSFDEIKGKKFVNFFAEEFSGKIQRLLSGTVKGIRSQMAEWDLIAKQKIRIRASWVCSPMQDTDMNTVGIVVVGRDLDERRKLEMELIQSTKFAALGVMAGGIAHEIRNPLAISSSSAQFLMEDTVTEEFRKECAEKIYTGIQRAANIIENLLRYARPAMNFDMKRHDLNVLLHDTLQLVNNQAKIKKINIITKFAKESIWISCTSTLLQQVFMNILLNAINAMPDGGTLTISLKKINRAVAVTISDTGIGIPEREIDNIFDPFYTTSREKNGTGLGLALSYSIVKQHAGIIEVKSEEDKGTDFIVKLPVRIGYQVIGN